MNKYMPLMGTGFGVRFDFLNEEYAHKNHGQSLEKLADRGGLSPKEMVCVMNKMTWKEMCDKGELTEIQAYRNISINCSNEYYA